MQSLVLSPMETYEFVTAALTVKQVPYIAGPPAIGKSQIVHQVAKDANAKMIDLRLSQMLSEDLTGIPERNEKKGKAYYLPFETFPLEGDELPDGYDGWILFLDELSSASEEVLAAAYSLILDRMVGGRKLHDKCLVVAAGNRATDSAIARPLPDTLITRMLPIEMKPNVTDWKNWAKDHPNKNDAVLDFISKNPHSLYNPINKEQREEIETYPSPRGWEKVFSHVNAHEKRAAAKKSETQTDDAGVPVPQAQTQGTLIDDMTFHLISAAVGPLTAQSFREHYDETIKLPFPWEVAQSPQSIPVPSSHVSQTKLVHSLIDHYFESSDGTRDSILIYMNRMNGENRELFCKKLQEKLSDTQSDKKLQKAVEDRLRIDNLFGHEIEEADPDGLDDPF